VVGPPRQRNTALQPDEPEDGAECLTGVAQVAWAAQRRPRGLKRPVKGCLNVRLGCIGTPAGLTPVHASGGRQPPTSTRARWGEVRVPNTLPRSTTGLE